MGAAPSVEEAGVNNSGDRMLPKYTLKQKTISLAIRFSIVAIQTFLAILGQGSLQNIVSLIGAVTMSTSCILLPLLMVVRVFGHHMSTFHKLWVAFAFVLCLVLAVIQLMKI